MTAPHCGRLDRHPSHEWIGASVPGPLGPSAPRIEVHECPGEVVTEGGGTPLCSLCGEQPAAPHGFGWCRWCVAGEVATA
jgi:hypothetical protein